MNFSTIYLRRFFLAIALSLGSIAAHATIALGEVIPASAGNCDGSIEVIANGTAGPFFIEIIGSDGFSDFVEGIGADDPAVGSYTFTGLCSGDYTIYVANRFQCTTTLTTSLSCSLTYTSAVTPSCTPGGGSISITPEGGTAPFYYEWRDADGDFVGSESSINNLTPGTYSVAIVDSKKCYATESFTIEPSDETYPFIEQVEVYAVINGENVLIYSASWQMTSPNCLRYTGGTQSITTDVFNAIANGQAELKLVAISNTPLSDLNVSFTKVQGAHAVTEDIKENNTNWQLTYATSVAASMADVNNGNIYFPITFSGIDYNGRSLLDMGLISADMSTCVDLPELNENCKWIPNPIEGLDDVHIIESSCLSSNFDFFTANVSYVCGTNTADVCLQISNSDDDAGIFSYVWETGVTGACASGLVTGQCYSVTVTDNCGRSRVKCIDVPVNAALSIAQAEITPRCQIDDNNGGIKVEVIGGLSPYTVSWNSDNGSSGTTGELEITNLESGQYNLTITDQCGQSVTTNYMVEFVNDYLSTDLVASFPPCTSDGSGSILDISTYNSNSANVAYEWSNGATTEDISNIPPGEYMVTVTDLGNGCKETSSFSIPEVSSYPLQIVIGTSLPCPETPTGSIQATVHGGSFSTNPPFTYQWSTGASFFGNEDEYSTIEGLLPGNYSVTVTDSEGCSRSRDVTLQSFEFDLNAEVIQPCNPSIILNPTPSFSSYSYQWSNGATTKDISGLSPDTYCVTVTNALTQCQETNCFDIESEMMEITIDEIQHATDNSLNNGSIQISVQGGTAPYSYSWSNGQAVEDIFTLFPGTYTVVITDANGCSITESINITYCDPVSDLSVEITPKDVVPCTYGEGSISPKVTGGTYPYTFAWTGPNGFVANTKNLTGLTEEGNYCLTVTDHCGNVVTNCQYIICDCPNATFPFSVQDYCLEFNLPPPFGTGERSFVELSIGGQLWDDLEDIHPSYLNQDNDDGGMTFLIEWENGDKGSFTFPEYNDEGYFRAGKTKYVVSTFQQMEELKATIIDPFGCTHELEWNFSKPYFYAEPIAEPLHWYIDDFYDVSATGYVRSVVCERCGDICTSEEYHLLEYVPDDPFDPCNGGGTITYHRGGSEEIIVEATDAATEFFNYTLPPIRQEGNICVYEGGCYFPWGTTELDKPVYIANTEIQIFCDDPPDDPPTGDCASETIIEYADNCTINVICLATGEVIEQYPNTFIQCHKERGDGKCNLVEVCSHNTCDFNIIEENVDCDPEMMCFASSCLDNPDTEVTLQLRNNFSLNQNKFSHTTLYNTKSLSTGIEKTSNLGVKVYPNPFGDILNVETTNIEEENVRIQLFNALGKVVFEAMHRTIIGTNMFTIDADNKLTPGVYFVKITDENGNTETQMVVH